MPYLVKDREHMKRIEEEIFWPTLAPLAEDQGYEILAVWENGFRHITNNVRPIETPEDLQGIKLRVPSGEWRVKMFQAYDANPTPMAFSEVFTALQTGVIDGQENPFAQIWSAKFQEVQDYLSLTGHVYTPAYVTAGKQRFESLPPEVQQVLEETAKETQDFVYETAGALENDLLTKLQEGGIQVNEADKDAFIAASQPIYDEFSSEVENGKELIDKALSLGQAS
jgi:TRAP-type transport system periplasmic protein